MTDPQKPAAAAPRPQAPQARPAFSAASDPGVFKPGKEIVPASPSELMAFSQMPMAMRIWFDDALFERARLIATYLAEGGIFTPPHLAGKPRACFAVVEAALTWRLSPYRVAACTYETPGGRVGFEGKLCHAILEASGHLEPGGVKYEHFGDWDAIQGKFKIATSQKGKEYAVPTWTTEDVSKLGLGVIVRAKLKGEAEPREWSFRLAQAFPRNSTLWATDPWTQICYTAVRRFGNVVVPALFMGLPFDYEPEPTPLVADAEGVYVPRAPEGPRPTRSTAAPTPGHGGVEQASSEANGNSQGSAAEGDREPSAAAPPSQAAAEGDPEPEQEQQAEEEQSQDGGPAPEEENQDPAFELFDHYGEMVARLNDPIAWCQDLSKLMLDQAEVIQGQRLTKDQIAERQKAVEVIWENNSASLALLVEAGVDAGLIAAVREDNTKALNQLDLMMRSVIDGPKQQAPAAKPAAPKTAPKPAPRTLV